MKAFLAMSFCEIRSGIRLRKSILSWVRVSGRRRYFSSGT